MNKNEHVKSQSILALFHYSTLISSHSSNEQSFSFIKRRRQKNAEKTANFSMNPIPLRFIHPKKKKKQAKYQHKHTERERKGFFIQ